MSEEHNLVFILARGLASSIATPVVLADPDGTLVYYNEPAEEILGQTFAEAGTQTMEQWGTLFSPVDPETGDQVDLSALPLGIALIKQQPAHAPLHITGLDGKDRDIEVTAIPLFAKTDEFIGAMAIFWEDKA